MRNFFHENFVLLKIWIAQIFLSIMSGITESLITAVITWLSGVVIVCFTIYKWHKFAERNKEETVTRNLQNELLQLKINKLKGEDDEVE